MKNNRILLYFLLIAAALTAYFASGPVFYFNLTAGLAALYILRLPDGKNGYLKPLLEMTVLVTWLVLLNSMMHFYSMRSNAVIAVISLFSAAAFLFSIFIFSQKESSRILSVLPVENQKKPYLNMLFAAAAGIIAWRMLARGLYIPAAALYSAAIWLLLAAFNLRPETYATQHDEAAAGGGAAEQELSAPQRIIVLVILAILAFRIYEGIHDYGVRTPVLMLAIAVFYARFLLRGGRAFLIEENTNRIKALDVVIVLVIFAGALYLRTQKPEYPGCWYDDRTSMSGVAEAGGSVYVGDPLVNCSELPFLLVRNVLIHFTGNKFTLLTLKLQSAIFGALEAAALYLLVLELFGRRQALIAGILMSVFFTQMVYSHQGVINIDSSTVTTIMVLFLVLAVRKGRPFYWAMTGVSAAMGFYFYNASRFIFLIILLYFGIYILLARDRKELFKRLAPGLAVMAAAFFAAFYPMLEYIIRNPSAYWSRVSYVMEFKTLLPGPAVMHRFVEKIIWAFSSLLTPNSMISSTFGLPSRPLIGPFLGFWFITGLITLLASWNGYAGLIILIWFMVGMQGAVFADWASGDITNRIIIVFPAIVIMISYGVEFILAQAEKAAGKLFRPAAPFAAAIVLAFMAFTNLNDYFNVYLNDPAVKLRFGSDFFRLADEVEKHKNASYFGSYYLNKMGYNENFAMRGIDTKFVDIGNINLSELYGKGPGDVFIAGEARFDDAIRVYSEYFPDAEFKTIYNYNYWIYGNPAGYKNLYGWDQPDDVLRFWNNHRDLSMHDLDPNSKKYVDFVTCFIPAKDIKDLYGLNASYYSGGKLTDSGITLNPVTTTGKPAADRITLNGGIYTKRYGRYGIEARGADIRGLKINGATVSKESFELLEGVNRIELELAGFSGEQAELVWKTPWDGNFNAIPAGNLITRFTGHGLIRTTDYGGIKYAARVYSLVNRTYWYAAEPVARSTGMVIKREWKGKLTIGRDGVYFIRLSANCDSRVFIDGIKTCENGSNGQALNSVRLKAGRHELYVNSTDCVNDGVSSKLELREAGDKPGVYHEVTYDMLNI